MANAFDLVKCRKCRSVLFPMDRVVDSHGKKLQIVEEPKDRCTDARLSQSASTVCYLTEDSTTWEEWITEQVDKNGWIKGKLFCPKCNFRLGSFDFVGGSLCSCGKNPLPPIHVTKSKVDFQVQEEISEIVDLIQNRPPNPDYNFPVVTSETSSHNASPSTSQSLEEPQAKLGSNEEKQNQEICSVDSKVKIKASKRKVLNSQCIDEDMEENIKDPHFLNLQSLLTCPVCLDIFYSPFVCKPCGHTFCEMCLRRIALSRPTQTACPLCRQLIFSCEVHREYSQILKANFHKENMVRSQHEDRALLQTFPLPWVPLHQFRNPEPQRTFLETALVIPRNFIDSFWLTLPTIGILFLLHSVGFIFFFLSYFGFSFIGRLCTTWIIPLWKIFFSTQEESSVSSIKSATDPKETLDSAFPFVYALFFAFLFTAYIWKRIRSVVL